MTRFLAARRRPHPRRVMAGCGGGDLMEAGLGGFAGLFAARTLRRSPVAVTLIDRNQYHLFQPLLYQCATGILSEGKIAAPLRSVLKKNKNVDCVAAEVVDAGNRTVIAHRVGGERIEFGYDDLIVAAGDRRRA